MDFEYDPTKSLADRAKHGIDFEVAQGLWADPDRLMFPARSDTEERFALIARLENVTWVAFFTVRGDRIRIISVRRARPNEGKAYEGRGTG